MKQKQIDEIIDALPKGKTYFYYFAEKYALMLLEWHARDGRPIRQIRQSNFARLLEKKAVRSVLPTLGDGVLKADSLGIWPELGECYLLTLGRWGRSQTSRKGFNTVLQVNFSNKHNQRYDDLVRGTGNPLQYRGHPVDETRQTLSWARIDIDMDEGEALIEEIQTDWIRLALHDKSKIEKSKTEDEARKYLQSIYGETAKNDPRRFLRYVKQALKPHIHLWAEVTLTAALWFIRNELGIRRIFYHTFGTGNWLKGIRYRMPPRSIYTDLPHQFCFQETYNPPSFIMRSRRRWMTKELEKLKFYVLEV